MRITIATSTIGGILGSFLLLCLLNFSACSRQANTASSKDYLPAFLKEVELGQTQATVLKLRPAAHVVNTLVATPWQQFTEDIPLENYNSVYYDFEKAGERQLVAITILHKDESSTAATFENFGGKISADNPNGRTRQGTAEEKIYASQKGRKVTFYLPIAAPENPPTSNQ